MMKKMTLKITSLEVGRIYLPHPEKMKEGFKEEKYIFLGMITDPSELQEYVLNDSDFDHETFDVYKFFSLLQNGIQYWYLSKDYVEFYLNFRDVI